MGLLRRKEVGSESIPRGTDIRAGNCIYLGEPFPKRGERIQVSILDVEFALDPPDVPDTWTGVAEFVRLRTGEPRERRVLTNILGTTLGMLDLKLDVLAEAIGVAGVSSAVRTYLRGGGDSVGEAKAPFVARPNGREYWDFEVIKIVSLMASPQARQARENGGWAYPDVWAGDSGSFPYPY